jgi:phosphoribosylaminoimidazole-succinocarboxamide synthase
MSTHPDVCIQADLRGFKLLRRGKVRDVYAFEGDLLMIATDRISAFDVVLPTPIPKKGAVLTQLSKFWFGMVADIVPNHLISADAEEFPPALQPYHNVLSLRTMLCRQADMMPVECVARGYLAGSGWKEYTETGSVCGVRLPAGLRECERLPQPVFTPATKAETGHDLNISFDQTVAIIGDERAKRLRDLTLAIYTRAAEYALQRGIIIADAKFEFGFHDGQLILCDEVLTPDSSRFWPSNSYEPGRGQPSFDKQYVRDYLEQVHFDKQPPGPELPPEVVQNTSSKYLRAYELLVGQRLGSR